MAGWDKKRKQASKQAPSKQEARRRNNKLKQAVPKRKLKSQIPNAEELQLCKKGNQPPGQPAALLPADAPISGGGRFLHLFLFFFFLPVSSSCCCYYYVVLAAAAAAAVVHQCCKTARRSATLGEQYNTTIGQLSSAGCSLLPFRRSFACLALGGGLQRVVLLELCCCCCCQPELGGLFLLVPFPPPSSLARSLARSPAWPGWLSAAAGGALFFCPAQQPAAINGMEQTCKLPAELYRFFVLCETEHKHEHDFTKEKRSEEPVRVCGYIIA
jgi:hypothetical protein